MNFKLKKYCIVLLVLCSSMVVLGQSNGVDKRVIEMYGSATVAQMEVDQPQTLAYLNYYIQYGYQIVTDLPKEKVLNFQDISSLRFKLSKKPVTVDDLDNLNLLMLDLVRGNDEFKTYRIGNTGKAIVFIAPSQVMSQFLLTQGNK